MNIAFNKGVLLLFSCMFLCCWFLFCFLLLLLVWCFVVVVVWRGRVVQSSV